jgi:PAS domain-containing protein
MGRYYSHVHDRSGDPRSRWGPRLPYLGVLLFAALVAWTAVEMYAEWQEQVRQKQAEAVSRLVQVKAPFRPTDIPGAVAWLYQAIQEYVPGGAPRRQADLYRRIARGTGGGVPEEFAPLAALLAAPAPPVPSGEIQVQPPGSAPGSGLRVQRYLILSGRWFVVTRRRAIDTDLLDPSRNPSDRFLVREAAHLLALGERLRATLARHPLAAFPGDRPPEVVRLYALSEDGTLLSLPWVNGAEDPAAQQRAARSEGAKLGSNPQRPTFASNEFYFRPDPGGGPRMSPFYPDLGGQGLVATLSAPIPEGIVSLDLAFAVDWRDFARQIPLGVPTAVVRLRPGADRGATWGALQENLPAGAGRALQGTVGRLAARERHEGTAAASTPYVLHGITEEGTVTAFNVAQDTWLAVLFPASGPRLPLGLIGLSVAVLGLAILGFERNRRRAEAARSKAEAALREKQNLLETMQVPLVVVDPNTDEVVFGNAAAVDLGLVAGRRFGERIAERSQEHYRRMQVAGPEPRRAYGVLLRVPGEPGKPGEEARHAVVRSVAVTAPIEALHADERHRLGVLFLLDPEADLALYTEEARAGERGKLAGLLSHGVDILTRILSRLVERAAAAAEPPPELAVWLAGYLDARVHTTAWLLERWGAPPPRAGESTIEAPQARATAERLESIFALVRDDAALRASLHWDNGALSARSPDGRVLAVAIDWPAGYSFTCPVRGGFGFFLSEALINAMRHGRPGTVPTLTITLAPTRRYFLFAVENERRGGIGGTGDPRRKLYGGLPILRELARLFAWELEETDLEKAAEETAFRLAWKVPASGHGEPGQAD